MSIGSAERTCELPQLEVANARLVNEARLVFVLIALLMELIHASPARILVLLVLLLYGLYGLVQIQLVRGARRPAALDYAHWMDVAAYALVSALTGGLQSRYAIFLLFPVLVASSRSGWRSGVTVALVCVAWFALVEGLDVPEQPALTVEPLSPTSTAFLFLVGLMIARWGHSELALKRRLALVTDLNRLFNPRHGLEYALYRLLAMLRTYQRADTALLVIKDVRSGGWLLHRTRTDADAELASTRAEQIRSELAQALLALPPEHAAVYARSGVLRVGVIGSAYHCTTLEAERADAASLGRLANLLETTCFISLPIRTRSETVGRVYLMSRDATYRRDEVRFLTHVMAHAGVMIENMQLVDRLAKEVASHERKRISRDLHDATIQPYIGLKLGLEALRRRVAPGDPLAHEVDDLVKIADDGILQLRSYVGSLKGAERPREKVSLLPAIRRQAEKFSEFYGIDAQVLCESDIQVDNRMYEEIMHIVREGLSNMRRHTSTSKAVIRLYEHEGRLALEFLNERQSSEQPAFMPRSIGERAGELGGSVRVEARAGGYTAVAVELPL